VREKTERSGQIRGGRGARPDQECAIPYPIPDPFGVPKVMSINWSKAWSDRQLSPVHHSLLSLTSY